MVLGIGYALHWRDSRRKQLFRHQSITTLPPPYHSPLTPTDVHLLTLPIPALVSTIQAGTTTPLSVLHAYTKRALLAHERTNCLTEILVTRAESRIEALEGKLEAEWEREAEEEGKRDGKRKRRWKGLSLAGVPVSLKDTVNVRGWDSCMGYSKYVGRPAERDSPLVRLLDDAGAMPFVKTNVPITLLSFESTNPVFGRTSNPHNPRYSPGGSTGGEAALLAFGGSRVGIGTDVAGSVRIPAHYSGVYTIRCSTGRFLKAGNNTSMPGQEGVLAVYSPMAKTLEDLGYFFKAIMEMQPWKYDHSVVPIPWRRVNRNWECVPTSGKEKTEERERRKVRWGVIYDDGVVQPSPACRRALDEVIAALTSAGDIITPLTLPSASPPSLLLRLASQLLNSDGGKTLLSHFTSFFERNDTGVSLLVRYFRLPSLLKRIHAFFVAHLLRDPLRASLLRNWHQKTVPEQWALVADRERVREDWFRLWTDTNIDLLLTVPHALPAIPKDGSKDTIAACGYTFMWNLLDYACGVMPVTRVQRSDVLPDRWRARNGVEKRAYRVYDAVGMEGLPVGVQVVGGRWEEEKVLAGMERIQDVLGGGWEGAEGLME